jgi:hypothetical protein
MLYVTDVDKNLIRKKVDELPSEKDVVMSPKTYLTLKSGCNVAEDYKAQVEELKKRLEILALIVEQPDDDIRVGLATALFSTHGKDLCELLEPYLRTKTIQQEIDEKTIDVRVYVKRGDIPQDILDMYKTKAGEKPLAVEDLSKTFFSLDDLEHTVDEYMSKFNV